MPRDATERYNRAHRLQEEGRFERAAQLYDEVARLEPGAVDALCNAGYCLLQIDRLRDAEARLRKALTLAPDTFAAHHNLGLVLQRAGNPEAAEPALRRAIALDPSSAAALGDLAVLLLDLGRPGEAIGILEPSRRANSATAGMLNTLALAHFSEARYSEAAAIAREGLARSTHADLHNTLGLALNHLGEHAAAVAAFRAAIGADPELAPARFNLASALLASGQRAAGWPEYAWRPQRLAMRAKPAPAPWLEAKHLPGLSGKRVRLLAEQGLGDEIFHFRFTPRLRALGASMEYAGDPRIEAVVCPRLGIARTGAGNPDYVALLGDLPGLLDDAGPPAPPLTLQPDPERVGQLAARLRAAGEAPYVGVTWSAGAAPDSRRAAALGVLHKQVAPGQLGAALSGARGTLVIVQRRPRAEDLAAFSAAAGRVPLNLGALNADLEEMLALLSLLDDYVGVSNTNMHLRAAAARPARVLAQLPPEWRWGVEGDSSPWFPGFRLYRQTSEGWNGALGALRREVGH